MQFEPQEQKGRTLNTDSRERQHTYDQSEYYGIPGSDRRNDEKLRPAASPQRPPKAKKGFPLLLIALLIIAALALGGGITHMPASGFPFSHGHSFGSKSVSSHMFKVTGQNTLMLNANNSSVHIQSGSSDSIVVQPSTGNGPFFGPPATDSNPVSYSQDGSTIRVNVQSSHQSFGMQDIDLDIIVPNGTILQINSDSGDVDINNFNGQVSTTTFSGNIKINNTQFQGQANIQSTSGDIDINGSFDSHGTYRIQTQTGDVHLRVPSNSPLQVNTSTKSGDVNNQLDNTAASNNVRAPLSIETTSGDIAIETFGSDQ